MKKIGKFDIIPGNNTKTSVWNYLLGFSWVSCFHLKYNNHFEEEKKLGKNCSDWCKWTGVLWTRIFNSERKLYCHKLRSILSFFFSENDWSKNAISIWMKKAKRFWLWCRSGLMHTHSPLSSNDSFLLIFATRRFFVRCPSAPSSSCSIFILTFLIQVVI